MILVVTTFVHEHVDLELRKNTIILPEKPLIKFWITAIALQVWSHKVLDLV